MRWEKKKQKKSLEQCKKLDGEEMRRPAGYHPKAEAMNVWLERIEHQALSGPRLQLPKGSDVCERG